jgi:hypothetical protein
LSQYQLVTIRLNLPICSDFSKSPEGFSDESGLMMVVTAHPD